MTGPSIGGAEESAAVVRHLGRMRRTWACALVSIPVASVIGFVLPRLEAAAATPTSVTLVAMAGSLWITFTAERDARSRLERVRRAFAVHGDLDRLLHDHWLVLLAVLVRLELVVVFGLVVAVWGSGPHVGVWLVVLAGLMIVLAWPTERKARLLIARARQIADA